MRKRIEVHDARSLEQALATVKRARITLNFSWLLKLRWAAVLGQLLAIAVVHYLIGVHLPRLQLLGIVLIATVSNIGLVWWFRRSTRSGAWDNLETSSEFLIGSIMTLDLFLLTGMLHVTGGASNPFTIFYIGSSHRYRNYDLNGARDFKASSRQLFLKFQYLFQI